MEVEMKNVLSRKGLGRRLSTLFWLTALVASFSPLTIRQLVAQQPSQRTFESPGEAAQAMVLAAKAGDTNELMQILGPQAKEVVFSGDPVADKKNRDLVVEKYQEMRRIVVEPDKSVTLYLGAENWPFPIPIVNKKGAWFFDTAKGKQEVLFRRIGRNESDTIDTLLALVAAQKEYESRSRDGGNARQFAQKIVSDEGRQNGLYWKSAQGQPQSPI